MTVYRIIIQPSKKYKDDEYREWYMKQISMCSVMKDLSIEQHILPASFGTYFVLGSACPRHMP